MPTKETDNMLVEYFVPIESSAELDGDFTINGIAINETTTSNGHKFLGEELKSSASTLIGVPLLKDHNNSVDAIVGVVKTASFDESARNIPFKAVVKDKGMIQKIKDGLLKTVSVGAHVDPKNIEETEDGNIIPHGITFKELSLVAVPADAGATFQVALNNALNSKKENSTITERRNDNMTEEEKTSQPEETAEAPKEESKEETPEAEAETSDEEKALDEKIKALRIEAKKRQIALMESDADEAKAEDAKEESKEETEEAETEEVEEKGDYKMTQSSSSFGVERKSYNYNGK
jgi:hypothetical protein